MYVNNMNILLLIYNVYNYDCSFGENKNKRTLIVVSLLYRYARWSAFL